MGTPSRKRMLVAIAAFHVPARESFLFRVIETYAAYSTISVDLIIDTNAAELRDALLRRFSGLRMSVNVLGVEDMRRFRAADLDAEDRNSDAERLGIEFWDLTRAHRHHFRARLEEFDFFLYSEDDVAVSEEGFQYFLERYQPLWKRNWLFGFYRTEVSLSGALQLPDHMRSDRIVDAPVFVADDGHWYVEPKNAYCAFWLVDREQLREFVDEPSGRYLGGEEGWDTRAKLAFGWQNGRVAGPVPFWPWQRRRDTWIPRVVHPIDHAGRLEPRAAVQHMPNNYANHSSFGVALNDLFVWRNGGPGNSLVPLPNHVSHPCPQ